MEPDTAVLAETETQEPREILAVTETTQTVAVVLAALVARQVAQPVSTSVACLTSHSLTMEPFKEERPDAVHTKRN